MIAPAPLALLLALLAPPPTGPIAVFWGGGRTWAVDLDAGRLLVSPGWIQSDDAGLWRYRLRRDADRPRPGPDGVPAPAHRWTLLERLAPGERTWRPITPPPTLPADGQVFDEQQVVQFAGDTVALLRFRRHRTEARTTDTVEAATLALPEGRPLPAPDGAEAAVAWLQAALPGVVEPCVDQPAGQLVLDTARDRRARWLVLAGAGRCAGRAHGLPLDHRAALPVFLAGGADLIGDTFRVDGRPVLDRVVDLRAVAGQYALILRGEPLTAAEPLHRDLMRLDDPCLDRELYTWRPGAPPVPIGRVPRLDGLRWLGPHDPLRAALAAWFRPADAPPCHRPLAFEDRPVEGHACRIEEDGRPWTGPDDLAAGLSARAAGAQIQLTVTVRDPQRSPADGVELFFGAGRRPQRARIDADGLDVPGGRRTRARVTRKLHAAWRPDPDGYTVHVGLDRALLGDPPSLSVRIDDTDPDVSGAARLWLVGAPIDGRNPRATPIAEDRR